MAEGGQLPTISKIGLEDLRYALANGARDFARAPQFGLFFGGFYAVGGAILVYGSFVLGMLWLVYPLVIGFALIGPFVATGLYEVSRRIENDRELNWSEVLSVMWSQHKRELGWMAFVMLFVFWIWMYQIRTLVAVFFGSAGFADFQGFLDAVLTTANGWNFLIAGHLAGAIISLVLFSITVVSCPLLLDRDVDFVTAMITSIRSVLQSPLVMLGWGVFVVVAIILSALPGFLGLLIVLPILGHATWHLYRRVIGSEKT